MKRYYYSRTKVDGMYRIFDRKLDLWIAAAPYKEAAHQIVEALLIAEENQVRLEYKHEGLGHIPEVGQGVKP